MPKKGYKQTEEAKKNTSKAQKVYWNRLSDEEKRKIIDKRYHSNEDFRKEKAAEAAKRPEVSEKKTKALLKYWSSLNSEQYDKRVESHLERWKNISPKDYNRWLDRVIEKGGWKNSVKGYYYSHKNNAQIFFQSSFELLAYKKLESDESVKSFKRCDFYVTYVYEGGTHRYTPDIIVEYIDNHTSIIEVKPECLVDYPKNTAKSKALQEYCKQNNFTCRTITETELVGVLNV